MMKKSLIVVAVILAVLIVSLGVLGLGGSGGADTSETGVSGEQSCVSQKCKQIDEVWGWIQGMLNFDANEPAKSKVWDPKLGWTDTGAIYTTTSSTTTAVSCTNAPIDPVRVKSYNTNIHTAPGSGHGWVKCSSSDCAVDLRPGNTCQEASDNARNVVPIKTPISGEVSQFTLDNDYGRTGSCVIVTDNSLGNQAVLCHVNPAVKSGDKVAAGSAIGILTNWGCGTGIFGPHLHFELKLNGKWIFGDGRMGTWKNQLEALGCTVS